MKKLICLLAVLVALMGLTVFELISGEEPDADADAVGMSSPRPKASPASRRARPGNDLPELQRVIQAQPDDE